MTKNGIRRDTISEYVYCESMELRSRVFRVALAGVAGLVAVMGSSVESQATSYKYMCTSIPSACVYAPSSAPQLNADVCFDGTTVTLKGASDCATGSYPFWLDAGEVIDPVTNEVAAYIPLPDACSMGFCVAGGGTGEPGAMCCDPSSGDCTETDNVCPSTEIAVWCDDGETPSQGQNGEWECHES